MAFPIINSLIITYLFTLVAIIINIFLIPNKLNLFGLNPILQKIIVVFIFSFISGIIVSCYSSYKKCKKINLLRNLQYGIKNSVILVFIYLISIMISQYRTPFINIFGDNKKGHFIAELFIMGYVSIIYGITMYFNSQKFGCDATEPETSGKLLKLKKYLNKKHLNKNGEWQPFENKEEKARLVQEIEKRL